MKKLSLFLVALTVATNSINADSMSANSADMQDNVVSSDVKVNTDLIELLDLVMQRDLLMKSMEGVFAQTSRGMGEEQKELSIKMLSRFAEKFDSKEVRSEMVNLYLRHYTNEEISEMLKFYKSPLGMKTIDKMPEIINESSQITIKIAQDTMMEFMPMEVAQQNVECLVEDKSECGPDCNSEEVATEPKVEELVTEETVS